MKSYREYKSYRPLPVDVPGIEPSTADNLEQRISEFEEKHLDDVISGGNGWVPKIKKFDIIVAVSVNAIIAIYWLWAVLS